MDYEQGTRCILPKCINNEGKGLPVNNFYSLRHNSRRKFIDSEDGENSQVFEKTRNALKKRTPPKIDLFSDFNCNFKEIEIDFLAHVYDDETREPVFDEKLTKVPVITRGGELVAPKKKIDPTNISPKQIATVAESENEFYKQLPSAVSPPPEQKTPLNEKNMVENPVIGVADSVNIEDDVERCISPKDPNYYVVFEATARSGDRRDKIVQLERILTFLKERKKLDLKLPDIDILDLVRITGLATTEIADNVISTFLCQHKTALENCFRLWQHGRFFKLVGEKELLWDLISEITLKSNELETLNLRIVKAQAQQEESKAAQEEVKLIEFKAKAAQEEVKLIEFKAKAAHELLSALQKMKELGLGLPEDQDVLEKIATLLKK
jgi:hypothetical protein